MPDSADGPLSISGLDDPTAVLLYLREMSHIGAQAHNAASEGGRTGSVRDLLFGINTMIDALATMVGEVAADAG